MFFRRISLGLLCLTMICSTGCNRSLRDLVGKSDFYSKDELADKEKDDSTKTVSQQTEVDGEDEKPSRLSRMLNVSALLRRDRDDENELGDDPFGVVTESESENHVLPVSADKAERLLVDAVADAQATADSAERAAERAAERTAEELLRKHQTASRENEIAGIFGRSNAATADIAKELEEAEESIAGTLTDGGDDEGFSFDEFLEDTRSDAKIAKEDAADKFFDSVADATDKAEDEFGEAISAAEEKVSLSDLFPEVDELLADTQGIAEEATAGVEDAQKVFDELVQASEDQFRNELIGDTQADRKQGADSFGFEADDTSDSDPWAAFRNSPSIQGSPVAADEPNWSRKAARKAQSFNVANPIDVSDPGQSQRKSPFQNVSSTQILQSSGDATEVTFDDVFAEADEPTLDLTSDAAAAFDAIAEPEAERGQASSEEELPATPGNPFADDAGSLFESDSADEAADVEDIFESDGIDASEELLEEDLLSTEAADAAPAEKTAGLSFGLSSKTWFLMVGLAIIGLLLFMPERKNQTN